MRLPIHGWVKTSLLDYPGHIASSIFLAYCNFKCPYCHNPDLVLVPPGKEPLCSEEEVIGYLSRYRKGLDGICVSGGEPLLHGGVHEFLRAVRSVGLKIKIDTNGSCPDRLAQILSQGLADYVAMDIKGPLDKMTGITRTSIPADDLKHLVNDSVAILKDNPIDYEFRMTVVPGLHAEEDFDEIGKWLIGSRRFVVQQFRPQHTLDPSYAFVKPFSPRYLEQIALRMKDYFEDCTVRGIG